MTFRAIAAAAVPILWMAVASVGRTGPGARDAAGREPGRQATRNEPPIYVPEVRLAQLCPGKPNREPLVSRNPFASAPRSLPPQAGALLPPPESVPERPSDADLSLIGIATQTRADGGAERTAIITAPGALYMVREPDTVTARFRVDAVLPDSVLLVDGVTGASLRLMLR